MSQNIIEALEPKNECICSRVAKSFFRYLQKWSQAQPLGSKMCLPKLGIGVYSFLSCHYSHNYWSIITNKPIPESLLIWFFKIGFTSLISHVFANVKAISMCSSDNGQITRNNNFSATTWMRYQGSYTGFEKPYKYGFWNGFVCHDTPRIV